MAVIEAVSVTKVFKRYEKEPGFMGSVKGLFHRRFAEKRAVSGFDLTVQAGEFVGLIGPNGAGKTTLIKMLTGIFPPTEGLVNVLGYTPSRLEDAFKRRFAVVMGQKSQLMPELTAADTFTLFRAMYDIPDSIHKKNLSYFIDLFGVENLLGAQVRTLSLGERMKMELIVALLHSPEILFLDEPTIGLDAVAQRQMRAFLREVNRDRGVTILLTSHYMEDIKALCPRCVVIAEGGKLYDGALDALLARYQHEKRITVIFENAHQLTLPENVTVVEQSPYKASLLAPTGAVRPLLQALIAQGDLSDLTIEEEDIGAVVERIYQGKEVDA